MAVEFDIVRGVILIGSAKTFTDDVKQADGTTAQSMTGWSLEFVIRRDDDLALVTKATGGSGITIGNGVGTDDRATIVVAAVDTLGLTPGWFTYGVWRTDTTNDVLLTFGRCYLTKASAQ